MWGPPILTGVLATTWDVTREAHGVGSDVVRTDQHSMWSTEREHWSKPEWDKEQMIRWDLGLGMDCNTLVIWCSVALTGVNVRVCSI